MVAMRESDPSQGSSRSGPDGIEDRANLDRRGHFLDEQSVGLAVKGSEGLWKPGPASFR
jgi:hypothetical protein